MSSGICESIEVTGDTSSFEGGLYFRSNETSALAPNNPVWQISTGGDRFISNTGTKEGWRIGTKTGLTSGSYYCKGKHIFF